MYAQEIQFPSNGGRTTMADCDAGVEEQKQIIEGKEGKELEVRGYGVIY